MKKIIYIDNYIDLEREFINRQNTYLIEESLLYSFSKQELKKFIKVAKEEYLKEKLPYFNKLQIERVKVNFKELDELSKYFVDMVQYCFYGGEEIELSKQFINRLFRFYRCNYEMNNAHFKRLDIKIIPIKEVIRMYVKISDDLRRNIRCIFPDHKDKSASLRIYENTNSFYCYGCHRGGNVINFISEIEKVSTKEAYKRLIKLYSNYGKYGY